MEQEQIKRILELKRIPLTIRNVFGHYELAIVMMVLGCVFLYMFFTMQPSSGEEGSLIIGLLCLIPAFLIFLYLGKKQLRLKKIQVHFSDDRAAYLLSKEVLAYYKWNVLEENWINYIKALRGESDFGGKSKNSGRAVYIFIEKGCIYAVSLYYPYSRAELFGLNARNIKLFERKLLELSLVKKPQTTE